MDHPVMCGKNIDLETRKQFDKNNETFGCICLVKTLQILKEVAKKTNEEWANILGINKSKQIGLIKPSGSVSQLCDCSSGIHPRMFKYYIRRVRQDKKDPLSQMLIDQHIPYIEEGEKYIFSFFIKSPDNAITSDDISAIEQLTLWKTYRTYWCDGNPSQTIYYTDDEYFSIADWIWKNWEHIGGLSFFPKNDHIYENAPYEKITKETYNIEKSKFPKIDWDKLPNYEKEDATTGTQELSCSGGSCELD